MSNLPHRNPSGYTITELRWVVEANFRIRGHIWLFVRLPKPPKGALTEMELNEYVRQLVRYTKRAAAIMVKHESKSRRDRYRRRQHRRIELFVIGGSNLLGKVDGAQRVIDVHGKVVSRGDETPQNRDPRPEGI